MKIIRMFLASFIVLGTFALAMSPPPQSQTSSIDQSPQQTQTTMAVEPSLQRPCSA